MSELGYITTTVLNHLGEEPGRLITVLEYACLCILLAAMVIDSILRRRRPTRQKSVSPVRAKIRAGKGMRYAMARDNRNSLPPSSSRSV